MNNNINFDNLVQQIEYTDHALQNNARLIINRHVTTKAWLTGYYIVEYEQHGSDRAQYGERLLQNLTKRLGNKKFSVTTLKIYRQFYLTYSQLFAPIAQFLKTNLAIGQSVTNKLQLIDNQTSKKGQSVTDKFVMPMLQEKHNSILVDSSNLFNKLSFTHLVSLIPINDPLKRAFYETMAINGTWSVRELQRQIDSNYYERSGWSKRPEELARMVQGNAEIATLAMDIKSPFVFEFLGLQAKDVIEESDLESALISNLQEFILELGMGFCFEERQKKLLIDDRYYKADLVFYHRILKRHVIIELKAHRLDYADVAQLNMYLAYYRKNIMLTDDNEPIGILLCSEVGQEMAEYTMMGADANLFLSKYQLELPSTEHFTEFLRKENEGLNKDINNQ
jgi:predicted nuclease of restriction endonuclease-like (RecB) superfamily